MPLFTIGCALGLRSPLSQKRLRELLALFLQALGYADRHLSLFLTNDTEIRALNRQYRQKDAPTDILAWSYWENDPQSECLGELMVSLERVRAQAKANGWDSATELVRLLAHGCAHLVGYDHERSPEEERRMLAIEIQLLTKAGYPALYPPLGAP